MSLRYDLMDVIETDIPEELETITIHDTLSIDWGDFNFKGNETNQTLAKNEVERPDNLSYSFYNTVIYQDLIFLVNNIGDILETPTKTVIKIPKLEDLKQFVFDNRKV